MRVIILIVTMITSCIGAGFAQTESDLYYPAMIWKDTADKGILLTSPTEILVINPKGDKLGKVRAAEAIHDVYISPDGKKIAYTTAGGIWLVKLETKENYLVTKGYCDFFHWNIDSSSFFFATGELTKDPLIPVANIKFFWADGNGKNLKQVYP